MRDMSLSQVLQTRLDSGLDDLVRLIFVHFCTLSPVIQFFVLILLHILTRRQSWRPLICLLCTPLLTCLSILFAILRTCQKRPFPSFGLVFRMKQHLTKLHYPLSQTVGQSGVLTLGKVRPGNPLYPLIHNRVVPISTSVCLRSGSSSRPMATRTERFSNFVSVKYQSCQ